MIELVFTACALLNPNSCLTNKLVFVAENDLTPMQCMSKAQGEMAKWSEGHPGYRITKYGCYSSSRTTAKI